VRRRFLPWAMVTATACCVAACGAASPGAAPSAWRLHVGAGDSAAYAGEGHGGAADSAGSSLVLRTRRPAQPGSWASLGSSSPAETLRARRVTLSADARTRDVSDGVTLWLRAEGPGGVVQFESTQDHTIKGTNDWTPLRISTRIDPRAVRLRYGLVLSGSGLAELRRLRLVAAAAPSAPIAPAAQAFLDSALALVKSNAYWRDTVSWSSVEPDVRSLAADAQTTDEVYPAIRHLLTRLGDHHSFVMSPSAATAWRSVAPDTTARAGVQMSLLDQETGYLRMPGFSSGEAGTIRRYETTIHQELLESLHRVSCGWIIDLRANGGGNMWPMLGALAPFLGRGPLGAFKGSDGVSRQRWYAQVAGGVAPPAQLAGLESAYVAVLTGPRTASSGEAVAIAFRGRARTRSFGEATAGFANANMPVLLPDGGLMMIMGSIDVDRDGHDYGHEVVPEEIVPSQPGSDAALDAARRWLRDNLSCSVGSAG
jgi:C-terminal processing protease CtpA/Prc